MRLRLPVPVAAAFLAALAPSACGREAPTAAPAMVEVAREAGELTLVNTGDGPLAYAVVEFEFLQRALISYGPCPRLAECTLAPGGRATIPYERIMGYEPGATRAVVLWWRVAADGTIAPAEPAQVVVAL